jgi:hypothetical protein
MSTDPRVAIYCLHCEKEGHRTTDCWSTHGLNTPRSLEIARLTAELETMRDLAADLDAWKAAAIAAQTELEDEKAVNEHQRSELQDRVEKQRAAEAELEEARKDVVTDEQILHIGTVDDHESGDDDPFGVDIAHVDHKQLISFARAILKAQGVVR